MRQLVKPLAAQISCVESQVSDGIWAQDLAGAVPVDGSTNTCEIPARRTYTLRILPFR